MRLVGENIETGVYPIGQALRIAREKEADLVEISPNAEPPYAVSSITVSSFTNRKKAESPQGQCYQGGCKGNTFRTSDGRARLRFKKKHAIRFLQEGSKIKAYVFFKGRSIIYKDQGEILLLRLATDLEEYGKVDQLPKQEGKQMIMYLSPKKKK